MKQNQSKTKSDRTQTRSFFQTRDLSLRPLKGRKTTEKSKLPQPPPHILSRTVLFTININYISILSKQILSKLCKQITSYKDLNELYLSTTPAVSIFPVNAPPWSLWMPLLVISTIALWQLMHLEKWCMDMVITRRAHCSHDCIHIMPILLLWDLSTLSIVYFEYPFYYA